MAPQISCVKSAQIYSWTLNHKSRFQTCKTKTVGVKFKLLPTAGRTVFCSLLSAKLMACLKNDRQRNLTESRISTAYHSGHTGYNLKLLTAL